MTRTPSPFTQKEAFTVKRSSSEKKLARRSAAKRGNGEDKEATTSLKSRTRRREEAADREKTDSLELVPPIYVQHADPNDLASVPRKSPFATTRRLPQRQTSCPQFGLGTGGGLPGALEDAEVW